MNLILGYTYRSICKNIHIRKISNCLYIRKNEKWIKTADSDFFKENASIVNKELITISYGGYNGLYMMGICTYIKQNYQLDNYLFSGVSAGAWNSLLLCCKRDISTFITNIILAIHDMKNLKEISQYLKTQLLQNFTTDDFDLTRLFIGTTTIENYKPISNIFYGFTDLEETIQCCMASSHLPLITGGIINRYNDMITFDGAFSIYPYLNKKSVLHITPSIWKRKKPKHKYIPNIRDYTSIFSRNKYNFTELYNNGIEDTKKNRHLLSSILPFY